MAQYCESVAPLNARITGSLLMKPSHLIRNDNGFWCVLMLIVSVGAMHAQTDISSLIGEPAHARVLPVRFGQANLDTGDLHLELPLYSAPERGLAPNKITLIYDSFFWHGISDFGTDPLGDSTALYPTGTGWSIASGDDNGGEGGANPVPSTVIQCQSLRSGDGGTITESNQWTTVDAHGTLHQFNLNTVNNTCTLAGGGPDTATQPRIGHVHCLH